MKDLKMHIENVFALIVEACGGEVTMQDLEDVLTLMAHDQLFLGVIAGHLITVQAECRHTFFSTTGGELTAEVLKAFE